MYHLRMKLLKVQLNFLPQYIFHLFVFTFGLNFQLLCAVILKTGF